MPSGQLKAWQRGSIAVRYAAFRNGCQCGIYSNLVTIVYSDTCKKCE